MQAMLAQAAAGHPRKAREGGFALRPFRRVLAKRMFMADGFGTGVFADRGIEPASGVQAARLSRQRQTPLAEAFCEKLFVELRQAAHAADAQRVQVLLRDLADAGNLANIE